MKFYKFFLVSCIFVSLSFYAQESDVRAQVPKALSEMPKDQLKKDEFGNWYYYDAAQKAKIYDINGEQVVVMDELLIRANPKFNNQLDRNFYFFLNKRLTRVYPLFLKALQQYRDLGANTEKMDHRTRNQYIKSRQQELAGEYEKQLRDLTTTEGQVFAKLMNRATGKTVYEIIRELRGGWSAFWWNVKGNMADVSLKTPYDPHKYREDNFLESLLISSWSFGLLQPYPGYEDYQQNK